MTTNEHEWTKEQIEIALAEGLNDVERARLARHLETCSECRAAMDASVAFDAKARARLAKDRPDAGFEDRLVRTLRPALRRSILSFSPRVRTAARVASVAAAALVMLSLGSFVAAGIDPETYGRDGIAMRLAQAPIEDAVAFGGAATGDAMRSYDNRNAFGLREVEAELKCGEELKGENATEYASAVGRAWGQAQQIPTDVMAGSDRLAEDLGREDTLRTLSEVEMYGFGGGTGGGSPAAPPSPAAPRSPPAPRSPAGATSPAGDAGYFRRPDVTLMQERAASASADARAESSRRGRDADRGDRNHANRGGASRADGEESREAGGGGPGGGASAPTPGLRLIRTGEMEFEVESFDGALMTVARIALEEQGVVASTNSEKLPNGKVRGVVTLRVPPEHLDNLVLKLRALGDLKSQRIVSQDVTKAWSDFSSELRAARAMEERLLEILRTARGKIEELLAVEKELSTWRGRIEQIQGELNFLNDRISMSTLTLTLSEKDIRQPHTAVRREVGTAGLETDAVEEAYKAVLKSVEEAEGRVIDSHLQQHDAGQVTARIQYEVAPDRFGGLIDRLRQLGNVVRLQVQREETLEGDATTHGPVRPSEVRQDPSRMTLSLYNLTNIAPRRSTQAVLAAPDAEGAYQAVLKVATDHGGRVVRSNLNRGRPETVTGSATLEVPSTSAGAALEAFRTLGELLQLAVVENPDTQGTTDAKEGFQLTIRSLAGVDPRETVSLQFASTRVEEAYGQILAFAEEADARIRVSNLQKTDERNVIGQLDFDLPSGRREAFEGRLASLGEVTQRQSRRADDAAQVVDSKFRVSMVLFDVSQVQPRETAVVGLEVSDVEEIRARLLTLVTDAGGRVVDSNLRRDADGRVVGSATCDVPMSAYGGVMNQVNSLGDVQSLQVQKNHNVPDSQIASARLQVTLSNRALIIPADGGIFARLRKDLGTSFAAVMKLLGLVLIGLSVAAPCLAILYAGVFVWRIVRKGRAA